MLDLISIGDGTIDHYVQIHNAEVRCNLDKTECMLCVEYGDKIPVDKLANSVGGNAANNAVGAARLGLKAAIYVNVGSDSAGKQIIDKLKQEGVSTKYTTVNEGIESNLSTILTFKGERTVFVYHQDWKYQLPDLELSRWVYFSSLSKSFTKYNLLNEIALFLERTGARLLYSPGTYQIQAGIKKHPKLLTLTEVFLVNIVEAKRILGYKDDQDIPIKKLLKEILGLGPKIVILTNGKQGSFGFDGEKYYHLDIFPADLVEITGAGDAFTTGVLAGLFFGKSLTEAMRWGAANSASVVEQIGPQAGLLTYHQMQAKLKQNTKIVAKEI